MSGTLRPGDIVRFTPGEDNYGAPSWHRRAERGDELVVVEVTEALLRNKVQVGFWDPYERDVFWAAPERFTLIRRSPDVAP